MGERTDIQRLPRGETAEQSSETFLASYFSGEGHEVDVARSHDDADLIHASEDGEDVATGDVDDGNLFVVADLAGNGAVAIVGDAQDEHAAVDDRFAGEALARCEASQCKTSPLLVEARKPSAVNAEFLNGI
jgi:hypothetical protein